MIAFQRGNTNRNPLVQFKETELQAREVVGTQISFDWAHGLLEVPKIKWVRTKFHTFRSVHFHLSLSPKPSFQFSEGLVSRLHCTTVSGEGSVVPRPFFATQGKMVW